MLKVALAAAVLLLAAPVTQALAQGAPDTQSVFELLQGNAYDEIYSTFDPLGSPTDHDNIVCVTASASSENCDQPYFGFAATELNGDGSNIVGSVNLYYLDPRGRFAQAAVWDPAAAGFTLLDDPVGPLDQASFADSPFSSWFDSIDDLFFYDYGTYAADISTGSQTVVGYALGTGSCGDCYSISFAFPLIWNPNNGGWDVGELLPFESTAQSQAAKSIGWATAISDNAATGYDREFVAGAVGHALNNDQREPDFGSITDLHAAVWTHTSSDTEWQREDLSIGNLAEAAPYSGAEDVNDLGQVVGWVGNLAPWTGSSFVDVFDYFDSRDLPMTTNLITVPVIWLPGDTAHEVAHLLDDTDQDEVSYVAGNALAIANDGSVVVGWGSDGDFASPAALAWIAGNGAWAEGTDTLINLQSEMQSGLTAGADSISGSIAESVDERGRLIVGKGFYGDYGYLAATHALYWELDADGNVIAGGSLEEALVAAGVPMDGKDLTLTDATGVRVVYDSDGNPTDVYITGTGTGSFGSWLATLSGITTPDSIGKGPKVVKKATDDVASVLGGIAEDQYCRRPTGTSVADAPWCYFVVGVTGGEISNSAYGLGLAKTVGIAKYTDESTSFGATGGLSVSHGHVDGGSSYTALTATVGAYADHSPVTGLQGRASVVLGRIIDAAFNRVYVNGASTSTSTGSTSGFGAGFFGRVGYASSLDEATRTIPFVEVRLATVGLDAFTDTGGTFNGSFDATSQTSGSIRIGIDGEHALNAQTLLTGGVSVTAAATTGTGVNATIAAQQFGVSGTGFTAYASGNIGVIYQIDSTSSFTGQTTGFVGLDGLVGGSVLAKYAKVF